MYEEIDENQGEEDEEIISTPGWSENPSHGGSKDHALHGISQRLWYYKAGIWFAYGMIFMRSQHGKY